MWRSNSGTPSGFRATGDGTGLFGRILRETAIALIWGYRLFISPLLPGSCRFTPTCSQFAEEAFRRHGPGLALWMSIRRLGRCHPFHPGGEDPVPRSR